MSDMREAFEESIVVALRAVGNADPFEVDIYKFAKGCAYRILQQAGEIEKACQST